MRAPETRAFLQVAAAAILWGISYLFYKLAATGMSPVHLSFSFSLMSALLLTPFALRRGFTAAFKRFPAQYFLLGLLSGPIAAVSIAWGLQTVPASTGVVLAKLEAIFAIILARVILREHLTLPQIAWSAAAIVSAPFVVTGNVHILSPQTVPFLAAASIAFGGFAFAGCVIIGRYLAARNEDPLTMVFLRALIGAVLTLPAVLAIGVGDLGSVSLESFGANTVSVAGTTAGFLLFYRGLRSVPASLAAVIELLTPLVTVTLGIAVLHEELSLTRAAAMFALIGSVLGASGAFARAEGRGATQE